MEEAATGTSILFARSPPQYSAQVPRNCQLSPISSDIRRMCWAPRAKFCHDKVPAISNLVHCQKGARKASERRQRVGNYRTLMDDNFLHSCGG